MNKLNIAVKRAINSVHQKPTPKKVGFFICSHIMVTSVLLK